MIKRGFIAIMMQALFRGLSTFLRHSIMFTATLALAFGIYVIAATFTNTVQTPLTAAALNATDEAGLPSEEAAARIIDAANVRRRYRGLTELRMSPALNAIAQNYASTFGVAEDALIFEYQKIQADLNAQNYYLGGHIYQLPGFVRGVSSESLFEYVVNSYTDEIDDPTVNDAGFAYVIGEDGTYYFSFLLADSLSLSAPGADLATAGDTSQESQQAIIVNLLNIARQERGLSTLAINQRLTNAAYNHSLDQAARDEMTHNGSDGSNATIRAERMGYFALTIGENVLVRNNLHASGAFDQWWNSPPHQHTMLHPDLREIGVAYAISETGGYYYTMVLGGSPD